MAPCRDQLELIAANAADLQLARRRLADTARQADEALAQVRSEWGVKLRCAASAVADREAAILDLVRDNQPLFARPQSVEFDGVRVGWRKGKGKLVLPESEILMKRIGNVLTRAQKAAVVKVKVSVLKGPLAKLPGEILKRLGVDVIGGNQEPFVSYPPSDAEKQVQWWLNPLAKSDEEAEA
jgi:hypothetical protein